MTIPTPWRIAFTVFYVASVALSLWVHEFRLVLWQLAVLIYAWLWWHAEDERDRYKALYESVRYVHLPRRMP